MPEEIVWNKKLLVISLLLGVVAAILFLVYDARMRKQLTGDTVEVLAWKRSLRAGAPIGMNDVDVHPVRKSLVENLKGLLLARTQDTNLLRGESFVSRNVYKGDFVRWNDILGKGSASPSGSINKGMRAVTLRVDPNATPGDMLRVNDRVDVIGLLSIGGKPARAYTVLQNVRVLAVGGKSAPPDEQWRSGASGSRYQPSLRSYRSVTIEVSPETAEKLAELVPRIQDKIWVALRPPPRGPEAAADGRINPEIAPIFKQPLPEDLGGE